MATGHITINNPVFDKSDLPEFMVDHVQEFVKHFDIRLDEHGFVTGKVSPSDVITLGYQLLAWTVLSNRQEMLNIIEQQAHEHSQVDLDQIDSTWE